MAAENAVASFGRPTPEENVEAPNKVPMPLIPVALAAAWEPESLKAIGDQVRETVAAAVVEGLAEGARRAQALQDESDRRAAAPGYFHSSRDGAYVYRYDPNPTLVSADRYAFQKYAEKLDREHLRWYTDPTEDMNPELAAEAQKRRRRDHEVRVRQSP